MVAFSASVQNLLTTFSAATSIVYGLGTGFFACGILSYCGIITEPRVSGKNFGFLYLIWSINIFLAYAISNYFDLSIMAHMWIMILVAVVALTLGNPEHE